MENLDANGHAQEMAALILKHLRGKTTPHEQSVLRKWVDADEKNRTFMESMEGESAFRNDLTFLSETDVSAAWRTVQKQTIGRSTPAYHRVFRMAAAILLLVTSAGVLYTILQKTEPADTLAQLAASEVPDIAPGGNKAILELADGSTVVLEDGEDGEVSTGSGTRISKQDNTLIYNPAAKASSAEILYNKVSTPTGGQFRIVLPDGTKVWLNAESSLRYPTTFTTDRRLVEMTGEAYFEVARNDASPFEVKVNAVSVHVLGTHFNIMGYENESTVNTTLVEGSVKVSHHNESRTIIPGQQARVGSSIELVEANLEEAVAWKNGFFQFSNTSLESILRQLERWYGADVSYENIPRLHFTGSISRNNNISEVLNMLELTGDITFKIGADRKVFVIRSSGP